MRTGGLVISLDFELHWGMCDVLSVSGYKENLDNVPQVIDELLNLFRSFDISATWCVVGLLLCKTKSEVNLLVPVDKRPQNQKGSASVYSVVSLLEEDFSDDRYHSALDIILKLRDCSKQEIGTHTFSHYHTLYEGATSESFKADIDAVLKVSRKYGIPIQTIVYPRGQISDDCNNICYEGGIKIYRGTENAWFYKTENLHHKMVLPRIFRLVDSYLNLSGMNSYALDTIGRDKSRLVNIPSSRFLRPFVSGLSIFESFRLRRIKKEMTHAAKTKSIYHLWWHPHNFGSNMQQNFRFLTEILKHFAYLKSRYNFVSYSMSSLFESVNRDDFV